jgi:hypothetical protein
MAGTTFDVRLESGTFIDLPTTPGEMTSKREMRRFLREHGWTRHSGKAWRAPNGSLHSLADAYRVAMNSVSGPTARRTDGSPGPFAKK